MLLRICWWSGAHLTALGRSQLSTTLPVGLTRATVAASLGLGTGMVIVALLKLPGGQPGARGAPTRQGNGV